MFFKITLAIARFISFLHSIAVNETGIPQLFS
jgi:hypothetical protein